MICLHHAHLHRHMLQLTYRCHSASNHYIQCRCHHNEGREEIICELFNMCIMPCFAKERLKNSGCAGVNLSGGKHLNSFWEMLSESSIDLVNILDMVDCWFVLSKVCKTMRRYESSLAHSWTNPRSRSLSKVCSFIGRPKHTAYQIFLCTDQMCCENDGDDCRSRHCYVFHFAQSFRTCAITGHSQSIEMMTTPIAWLLLFSQ